MARHQRRDTQRTMFSVIPRRDILRIGLGVAGTYFGLAETVEAQRGEATPQAEGPSSSDVVPQLPAGVNFENGYVVPRSDPKSGGTLQLQRPGQDLNNLNPAAFAVDPQIPLSYLEPLVRPDPATLKPEPWLAQSWTWQADGKELSFVLRDGVTWHDGTPLSAADAEFSYQVYREDIDSAVSELFSLVESIETPAELELTIRFSERDANWLFNVATLPIFSRRQYEEHWIALPSDRRTLSGFDWTESVPQGTGPWQMHDRRSSQVTFRRYEGYWRQPAWMDELSISLVSGTGPRLQEFEQGETQLLWPVRGARLPDMSSRGATVYRVPAASVMFAAFNFANPTLESGSYWSDLRVRRAVSMAINRERYAAEVFNGFLRWEAAGTVAQPWAHDDTLKTPAFNSERASVLLGEAGWADYNGDGVLEDVNGSPFSPTVIVQDSSRAELIALLGRVVRDLAEVGIVLTIESLSGDAFDRRWIDSRDYDLIAYAYDQLPGFTDYDLYGTAWDIRQNPVGWNPGGYNNPDADAAIAAFLDAVSIERQAQALKTLQRAVDDDLFGLWFGFPDDVVLVAAEIDGFQPDLAWQTARTWDVWRRDVSD